MSEPVSMVLPMMNEGDSPQAGNRTMAVRLIFTDPGDAGSRATLSPAAKVNRHQLR